MIRIIRTPNGFVDPMFFMFVELCVMLTTERDISLANVLLQVRMPRQLLLVPAHCFVLFFGPWLRRLDPSPWQVIVPAHRLIRRERRVALADA